MKIVNLLHITMELWGSIFCLIAGICVFATKKIKQKKYRMMLYIQASAMILLISDALAWYFRGKDGTLGFFMVRISNGMAFTMGHILLLFFLLYACCCIGRPLDKGEKYHVFFIIWLCLVSVLLVALTQFTGFLYSFDEHNFYHRENYFFISQMLGILETIFTFVLLIRLRKCYRKYQFISFAMYLVLPTVAMIVQIFFYGISLLNIAITISVLAIFVELEVEEGQIMLEQERELNKMRVDMLLWQIKPHFLYNCLNTIKYLCRNNPKEAEETVEEFAQYLRNNIDTLDQRKPISIEQELSHVRNYLELEKKRFGDRIHVVYHLRNLDFQIPAFTLQPLVENCVKHGIMKKKEGGTITIETMECENSYRVRIADDGLGYDLKEVSDINRKHIGIENVKIRLKNMCNGELEIQSKQEEGTSYIVSIPKR